MRTAQRTAFGHVFASVIGMAALLASTTLLAFPKSVTAFAVPAGAWGMVRALRWHVTFGGGIALAPSFASMMSFSGCQYTPTGSAWSRNATPNFPIFSPFSSKSSACLDLSHMSA